MHPNIACKPNGFTLVELIISMLVISIALVGIFSVINITTKYSADPIVRHQAIAIAETYMEEILQQNYPNATDPSCTTSTIRANFNCVDNYKGLVDVGAHDQMGNAISSLANYTITVSVANASILTGNVYAKQISVSVSGPGVSGLSLVAYKANY